MRPTSRQPRRRQRPPRAAAPMNPSPRSRRQPRPPRPQPSNRRAVLACSASVGVYRCESRAPYCKPGQAFSNDNSSNYFPFPFPVPRSPSPFPCPVAVAPNSQTLRPSWTSVQFHAKTSSHILLLAPPTAPAISPPSLSLPSLFSLFRAPPPFAAILLIGWFRPSSPAIIIFTICSSL